MLRLNEVGVYLVHLPTLYTSPVYVRFNTNDVSAFSTLLYILFHDHVFFGTTSFSQSINTLFLSSTKRRPK